MPATVSRRAMLRLMAIAATCPLCSLAGAEAGVPAKWGYDADSGPAKWGGLSAEFRACSLGKRQAPLDLTDAVKTKIKPLTIAYQKMPVTIENNGYTIQVTASAGSRAHIGDTFYDLIEFHFHHPSEHLLAGKRFDLECHFMHRSAIGEIAVIGVLIKPGKANRSLEPIWQAMPSETGPSKAVSGITVDTAALLPKKRRFYRYMGSLTTPPCDEDVLWTVFEKPVEASPEQIRRFAALFPDNARPVQPLNGRFLLETPG